MKHVKLLLVTLAFTLCAGKSWADEHLKLQEVTGGVYAIVGDLGNRSKENLGNNATFGFVVTEEGVVLIDSGGTYAGAERIHQLIKSVTDQPIVQVINTGGQDHRWLGNGYFKQQGAQIIASEAAVADQRERVQDQLISLTNLLGDELMSDTLAVYADHSFAERFELKVGGIRFESYHTGPAHTPGDSYVWLPQKGVMFAGDIVYVERMLGVGPQSNSKSWIDVFDTMAGYQPQYLIPGHGQATNLARAKSDTYDYLVFLRQSVADFMAEDGDIADIGSLDQSKYSTLQNFDIISGRNAQQVYSEMEWE